MQTGEACPVWLLCCERFSRPCHRLGAIARRSGRRTGSPARKRHSWGESPAHYFIMEHRIETSSALWPWRHFFVDLWQEFSLMVPLQGIGIDTGAIVVFLLLFRSDWKARLASLGCQNQCCDIVSETVLRYVCGCLYSCCDWLRDCTVSNACRHAWINSDKERLWRDAKALQLPILLPVLVPSLSLPVATRLQRLHWLQARQKQIARLTREENLAALQIELSNKKTIRLGQLRKFARPVCCQ